MRYYRRPSLLGLVIVSLVLLVSFACNMPTSETVGLRLDQRAADGSLAGSYRYSREMGQQMIQFSVDANGFASFRLEDAPAAEELTVDMRNLEAVELSWQGANLDGVGILSQEEEVILANLSASPLAHGLSMIPLDVACQGDDAVDPQQVAALLVPLQMLFKYQIADRAAAASELAALSQCDYGSRVEDADRFPSVITMTPANPVPVVLGFFPFDAEGALEVSTTGDAGLKLACPSSSDLWGSSSFASPLLSSGNRLLGVEATRDEYGPCLAKCRGACGPDCTINNCKLNAVDRCEKNQDGKNNGFLSMIFVYDCGLHPACIEHDQCYDDCNRRYGCNSWLATFCMHGMTGVSAPLEYFTESFISCDSATLIKEGPANVKDWVRGYGPQPIRQTFEYTNKAHRNEYDPVRCPIEEEPDPEEMNTSPEEPGSAPVEDVIPVGSYAGTLDYYSVLEVIFPAGGHAQTDQVLIQVHDDGTVTGSLAVDYTSGVAVNSEGCESIWDATVNGTFSGKLSGSSGVIDLTQAWVCNLRSSCEGTGSCDEEPVVIQLDIQVVGNEMTGASRPFPDDPDDLFKLKLTATKQ